MRDARERAAMSATRRAVFLAFFLSGAAGLMHEVVWSKLLVGLIGATAYANAVVLAVFMGGLALGSLVFGNRADRGRRPLRTYIVLELLIAGYCLLLPLFLKVAGLGYIAAAGHFFESPGLKLGIRFALTLAVVLPPAVLMGGTLPILARHLIGKVEETRRNVAGLYALNGLGAVVGAGVAGFVTLPMMGLYPSLIAASLLNGVAALVVLGGARREAAAETGADAASGFAAMGYEVLFMRVISLSFGLSTYSFTVMLMCFITGVSLGSGLMMRLRVRRPLWLLGISQLAVVVSLLVVTPLITRLPYLIALMRIDLREAANGFAVYQLGKAALCLGVLLLPTVCLGFTFPLVAQVQARHPDTIGTRVGSTYAWNTIGNVLGAVLTAIVLLPSLGLLGSFHFNLALNLTAGIAVLVVAGEAPVLRRTVAVVVATVVAAAYLAMGTGWPDTLNLARDHLRLISGPHPAASAEEIAEHPASSFDAWKRRYVVREEAVDHFFFEEDAHATVMAWGMGDRSTLYVNTKPDAGTGGDMSTQMLLGHAPMFLAPDARSVLVIGHGSGISMGSALRHPVEQADLVEISRAVLDADALFAPHNYGVLHDPRVRIYLDDAQSFLRTVPRKYDVIISEPSNPWVAGIAGLFTVESFEDMRARLNPGGLATIWFHSYEQSNETVELVLRTIGTVFPHAVLFRDLGYSDIIVVASAEPIEPDFAAMERRFDESAIRDDLARLGISNLTSLFTHQAISESLFRKLTPPGPLNTMGNMRLEYAAPRSYFLDVNSDLVSRFDPLFQRAEGRTDLLLDRYIDYRAALGDPVRQEELVAAARYAGRKGKIGMAIGIATFNRAKQAPRRSGPPVRPARGPLETATVAAKRP